MVVIAPCRVEFVIAIQSLSLCIPCRYHERTILSTSYVCEKKCGLQIDYCFYRFIVVEVIYVAQVQYPAYTEGSWS